MRSSRTVARLVASGFGAGYAPVAPGTVGAAFGLALGGGLFALGAGRAGVGVAAVLSTVAGVAAIRRSDIGDSDPGWVVIDEIAGQLIAVLAMSTFRLIPLAVAFALFRLFDIAKPGPVGWVDRHTGAVAIMGDDLIAGAFAALVGAAVALVWPAAFR